MHYGQRLLLALLLFSGVSVRAQSSLPFADEIAAFARQDSLQTPPVRPVLFVGSSSIRLWKTLQSDFAGHRVLNRGFGGATIPDMVRYADETIYRYRPAQIVFYCGENDLASSDTIQAATVVRRFTDFFTQIRSRLPGVPFVFIAIKPSPSRAHLQPRVLAANVAIRRFLAAQKSARFVDVYHPMLGPDGRPQGALFTADSLHMNPAGYALWRKHVAPVLRK